MKPYEVLSLLVSPSFSCSHQAIVSTECELAWQHSRSIKKKNASLPGRQLSVWNFFKIWRSSKWPQLCEVLNEVLLSSSFVGWCLSQGTKKLKIAALSRNIFSKRSSITPYQPSTHDSWVGQLVSPHRIETMTSIEPITHRPVSILPQAIGIQQIHCRLHCL